MAKLNDETFVLMGGAVTVCRRPPDLWRNMVANVRSFSNSCAKFTVPWFDQAMLRHS